MQKRVNRYERGDEARIAAAAAALEDVGRVISTSPADFTRLQARDAAFHMRIVEAAGNRFLEQTLGIPREILATGKQTTLLLLLLLLLPAVRRSLGRPLGQVTRCAELLPIV